MTTRAAGAVALAAVLTLGGCGTTYVDTQITIPATGPTTTTTLPPVPEDAPLVGLFDELAGRLLHLDELIIDAKAAPELERIEEVWAVAERRIRDHDPDDLYPFEQALELARSGVERNRAADASKAYKVLIAAVAAYDLPDAEPSVTSAG